MTALACSVFTVNESVSYACDSVFTYVFTHGSATHAQGKADNNGGWGLFIVICIVINVVTICEMNMIASFQVNKYERGKYLVRCT